jgi:hypothetical protein
MKNTFKNILLVALFSMVLPAQAAVQLYNFNGVMDSGAYNGSSFSGSFSFDDATIDASGLDIANLLSFDMNFLSTNFTLANTLVAPDVSFQDGTFLGLSLSIDSITPNVNFTFVPGIATSSEASIAYDVNFGVSGAGNVVYAPVPEADRYAMFLAGLGVMGAVARRRKVA